MHGSVSVPFVLLRTVGNMPEHHLTFIARQALIDDNRPIPTTYGMPLKDSCQLMIRVRTAKSESPTPDFTVKWPHSPKNGLPRRQTTPGLPKWNSWLGHPALAQHVGLKKHRRFWSPAQNALTTTQIMHHPKEPNFAAKRAVY